MSSSPIVISIPAGINAGSYQAILTVTNTNIPATSVNYPITVIVNPAYTFTQDIGTTLQVGFTAVTGASLYTVSYRVSGGSWVGKSATTNSAKIINLTPGTNYEWKVTAYNASGSQLIVFPSTTYTTTTFNYSSTKDIGTTCLISWLDCSTWASTYVLQYKPHTASTWTSVSLNVNEKKITGLTPLTIYDVKISVYKLGSLWGTTAQTTFTTGTVNFSATNLATTTATITWVASLSDLTSWQNYSVFYYRPVGSSTWVAKAINSNSNTINLTKLTAATNYECYAIPYFSSTVWGSTNLGTFTTAGSKEYSSNDNNSTNVYPNPFISELNLSVFAEQKTTLVWNLYDINGKLLQSGEEAVSEGYNTLNISTVDLPEGLYMMNVKMDDQVQNFRLMKQ